MEPGSLVGGRFRLLDLVGAGGMGSVYRAQDEGGGFAAVKLAKVGSRSAALSLLHEAELLSTFDHRGIVGYCAHGELADGAWLAMRWLEGPDVADLLVSPGLSPGEAVRLALRVAEALGALHEAGVVHADLKPSNLLARGGQPDEVRIVDLGVARSPLASCPAPRAGVVVGTPGFMAPEQIRGDAAPGPAADVFALGCVLFEAIAGRATFEADDALGLLTRTLLEETPRLDELRRGLPRELVHLVAAMLAKEPAERPADGAEAARQLRRIDSLLTRTGIRVPWGTVPPAPALTEAERHITSLVLAAPPGTTDADLDVGRTVDSQLMEANIEGLASHFEARVEALPGGAVLASFEGEGDVVGQVTRAGALALELRVRMPDNAFSLTTGSVERDGARFLGAVIDRAVAAVRGGTPGDVLLDEVSAGLMGARFTVRRSPEGARLERARSSVVALRHFAGAPAPCLGREEELGRLDACYEGVLGHRGARGILVRGPAGIGKSRLVSEFVNRLTKGRTLPTLWLGAGDPMLQSVPFAPWARALRRLAGMREGDPPRLARRKLRAEIARNVEDARAGARHEEFLGALLGGLPDSDDSSVQWAATVDHAVLLGDQIRRALEESVASACRRGPVLVVLEDLPFTDEATRVFAGRLLRNLADARLMVLATTNSALGLPGAPEACVEELVLGGLPDEASEALVRGALEDVDGEQLQSLLRSAGGNGLLLEEVVRATREGRGGSIPETALAVLQARLEALPKGARRAPRAASLFGHSAHRGGIAQLLGGEEAASTLDESLERLSEEQLLVPTAETRFVGEDGFAFRHALVREAAYAMLTDDDRGLGHRLAGQWLESVGEREPSILAEHFHAGGLPERANELYVEAAQKALAVSDFLGALEHAERAHEGGVAGQLCGALWLVQAEAYRWRGDLGDADRSASQALSTLDEGGRSWFVALAEAASVSARLGRQPRLLELAKQLRSAPARSGAEQARALALGRVSSHLCSAGRVEEADALLVLADDFLREPDGRAPGTVARLRRARAHRALVAGDLGAYAEETSRATTGFDRAGDERNGCNERVNLGYVFLELGLDKEAREALEDARETALRLGLSWLAGAAEHNLGRALLRVGELEEAERVERDGIERFRDHADRRFEAGSRVYLAQILSAADRGEDAEREACAAIALAQTTPPLRPYALATLALVQLRAGRLEEARESAREASLAREAIEAMEEGEATLHLVYIEVLLAQGEHEEAREQLAHAMVALSERAAKIGRSDWRRSFLRGVPDHARLLHLGAEHGVPGPA